LRALPYLAVFLITGATCQSEPPETTVAALLAQSDAVIVGELRHQGGVCATGGIFQEEHFEVLSVLAGTVSGSSVSVGFQWKPGDQATPPKVGEKMVLFLKAPSVPVRGYWYLQDVHAGAQPYSQALEAIVRNLVAQRH
jgi:hypothetical protein